MRQNERAEHSTMTGTLDRLPLGAIPFPIPDQYLPADYQPLIIARQYLSREVPLHCRNHQRPSAWLVKLTLAGMGMFADDRTGRQIPLPPGTAFIVPFPSPTQYWRAEGRDWDFLWLLAKGPGISAHATALDAAHGPVWELDPRTPAQRLLLALHEHARSTQADPLTAAELLHRLVHSLWRQHQQPDRCPPALARALATAAERLGDPNLGVADLAAAAGISPAHFARQFQAHHRCSPYAWIINRRLERAMELITTSTVPLSAVARQVGMPSYPHFCHRFRRRFGLSPSSLGRA